MVSTPVLRQLLCDRESLRCYYYGRIPSFDDVKRRLFLLERARNTNLPDHYYHRAEEEMFDPEHEMGKNPDSPSGITSLPLLLSRGFERLAENHLEERENRLYVKRESWRDWQELITYCPPLVLIAGYLWKNHFPRGERDLNRLAEFAGRWLLPNARYTCLLSPYLPEVEELLNAGGGFYDLHAHLNGSTETDFAWQKFLKTPRTIYKNLRKNKDRTKVLEQFEQEAPGMLGRNEVPGLRSIKSMLHLLRMAQRIRRGLCHRFWPAREPRWNDFEGIGTSYFLSAFTPVDGWLPTSAIHPLVEMFADEPESSSGWPLTCLEGLLYVLLMDELYATRDEELAKAFHCYMLVLGCINRFLVQQRHQVGFDQFEKIANNEFRSHPEREYKERFHQMNGNEGNILAMVEGRFAPKSTPKSTVALINTIVKGWEKFTEELGELSKVWGPGLHLVAHFIKDPDRAKLADLPVLQVRHKKLRLETFVKGRALATAWEINSTVKNYLAGVDAANNELEANPEVFAPTFRYLKRKHFTNFTYHAGEDFHHLVGGLRAIHEAVDYLGLKQGARIGHGTAAGISPDLWLKCLKDELPISRGEWADDLLFVLNLCQKDSDADILIRKKHGLLLEFQEHAEAVYRQSFSLEEHIAAWKARGFCPFHLLLEEDEVRRMALWDLDEWVRCLEARAGMSPRTLELCRLYHMSDVRRRYSRKVRVDLRRILDADDLRALQAVTLKKLHDKGIALETLPSSNVCISFYHSYSEHHLWSWLGKNTDGNFDLAPPVLVGTDDTGIFATNIRNEFAHIFETLTTDKHLSVAKTREEMAKLRENARVYGFRAKPGITP